MNMHRLRVVTFDTAVDDNSELKPRREKVSINNKANECITHEVQLHKAEISQGSGDKLIKCTGIPPLPVVPTIIQIDSENLSAKATTSITPHSSKRKWVIPRKWGKNKKRIRFQALSLLKFNKSSNILRNTFKKRSTVGKKSVRRKNVQNNGENRRKDNIQVLYTHEGSKSPWNITRRRSQIRRHRSDRNRHLIYGNSKSSQDIHGFNSTLLNPYLYYQYSRSPSSCRLYQSLKNKLHSRKKKQVKKCCSHHPLKVMRDVRSESSCYCPRQPSLFAYNLINFCDGPTSRRSKNYGSLRDLVNRSVTQLTGKDQAVGSSSRTINRKSCGNACVGPSSVSIASVTHYGCNQILQKLSKVKTFEPERRSSVNELSKRRQRIDGNVTNYLAKNFYSKHHSKPRSIVKSILLGFFAIVWSPCVLICVLGWALISPLRPSTIIAARYNNVSECKNTPHSYFLPSPSSITHTFSDAYKGLLSLFTGNVRDDRKTKCSQRRSRYPHHGPSKKDSLYYKNNSGWMANSLRNDIRRRTRNLKFNRSCDSRSRTRDARKLNVDYMATQCKCYPKKYERFGYCNKKTSTPCANSHVKESQVHIQSGSGKSTDCNKSYCMSNRCAQNKTSTAIQHQPPSLKSRNICEKINCGIAAPNSSCAKCSTVSKIDLHMECTSSYSDKLEDTKIINVDKRTNKDTIVAKDHQEKLHSCQQCTRQIPRGNNSASSLCSNLSNQEARDTQPRCKHSVIKFFNKLGTLIGKFRFVTNKLHRFRRKSQDQSPSTACKNPNTSNLKNKIPISSELCINKNTKVAQPTSNPIDAPCSCLKNPLHDSVKLCNQRQKQNITDIAPSSRCLNIPIHIPGNKQRGAINLSSKKYQLSKDIESKSHYIDCTAKPDPCECLSKSNQSKHCTSKTRPNVNKGTTSVSPDKRYVNYKCTKPNPNEEIISVSSDKCVNGCDDSSTKSSPNKRNTSVSPDKYRHGCDQSSKTYLNKRNIRVSPDKSCYACGNQYSKHSPSKRLTSVSPHKCVNGCDSRSTKPKLNKRTSCVRPDKCFSSYDEKTTKFILNKNTSSTKLDTCSHVDDDKVVPKHKHSGLDRTLTKFNEIATQLEVPATKVGVRSQPNSCRLKLHDSPSACPVPYSNNRKKTLKLDKCSHGCVKCRSKNKKSGLDRTTVKLNEITSQFNKPVSKVCTRVQTMSSVMSRGLNEPQGCPKTSVPNSKKCILGENKCIPSCNVKRLTDHKQSGVTNKLLLNEIPAKVARTQTKYPRLFEGKQQNCNQNMSCPKKLPRHLLETKKIKKFRETKKNKKDKSNLFGAISSKYGKCPSECSIPSKAKLNIRSSPLEFTLSKLSKLAKRLDLPASKVGTRPKNIPHPGYRQIQVDKCTQSFFKRNLSNFQLRKCISAERFKGKVNKPEIFECCGKPNVLNSRDYKWKKCPSPDRLQRKIKNPEIFPCRSMFNAPRTKDFKLKECSSSDRLRGNAQKDEKLPNQRFMSLDHMTAFRQQLLPKVTVDLTNPCLARNYQCSRSKKNKKQPQLKPKKDTPSCPKICNPSLNEPIEVKKKKKKVKKERINKRKPRKARKPCPPNPPVKHKRKPHRKVAHRRRKQMCTKLKRAINKICFFDKAAWPKQVPCNDMYVYTLKEKPWFWIYEKYPKLYPCFLSWYRFYQNSCRLIIYSVASVIWCPLFFSVYVCCSVCKWFC